MTWAITFPVTGAAQTGLVTPTYTGTLDVAPDINGKQHAISAIGGTQTGVRLHAISDPFTITFNRAKSPKGLGSPNPVTGKYGSVAKNVTSFITRKGVNFAANNAPIPMLIRTYIEVPAGADAYDAANVRAALSCHIGALSQQASGVGDTAVTGVP